MEGQLRVRAMRSVAENSSPDQDALISEPQNLRGRMKSMSDIRVTHVETKTNDKGKIIAAAVVGLAVLAGGVYLYREGWWKASPKPAVASSQLPQVAPPVVEGGPKPM
jgi:hypothetical protein